MLYMLRFLIFMMYDAPYSYSNSYRTEDQVLRANQKSSMDNSLSQQVSHNGELVVCCALVILPWVYHRAQEVTGFIFHGIKIKLRNTRELELANEMRYSMNMEYTSRSAQNPGNAECGFRNKF